MIEAGLYNLISSDIGVSALCATRVYPDILPSAPTYPAVTYSFPSGRSSPTSDTSGMQRERLQLECFAESAQQAIALRAAIRSCLEGFRGTLSDGTYLQDAQLSTVGSGFNQDARVYRRTIEFFLLFNFSS